MSVFHCEVCCKPLPERTERRGKPRVRHAGPCSRCAEGVAAVVRLIEAEPAALLYVAERLEQAEIDRAQLTNDQLKRIRSSLFTLASKGRRIKPGSSGRYTRKS